MPYVAFRHPQIGTLITENGIDSAAWSYGLNTATFPTYGGEVVQILSAFIDDLTITGTLSTYRQMEAVYSYFSNYLQVATQGKNKTATAQALDRTDSGAYNLDPIVFTYPERGWSFNIYPMSVPGFHMGTEVIAPTWQLVCFVEDDSPDLSLITDGIKALAVKGVIDDGTGALDTFAITGNISPQSGNPNTDPFQTYDSSIAKGQQQIQKYSEFYNSLIPAYSQGDFAALTGEFGSRPNFGQTKGQGKKKQSSSTVVVPKKP